MTPGTIRIWDNWDVTKHVLLYTVHTAMDIPKVVQEAPVFLCKHRFGFLLEKGHGAHRLKTKEACLKHLAQFGLVDGLWHAPSVASMLIACHPWMLSPYPPAYEDEVPEETGYDYMLHIGTRGFWCLHNTSAEKPMTPTMFTPVQIMVDWFWGEVQSKRRSKKKD
jgi:hypothetical protein